MRIGIPKEILPTEKRVAAIPRSVSKYVDLGFDVVIESSAGEPVFISDEEYKFAGAKIIADTERLFIESDIIIKVNQPVFNNRIQKHEVNMLQNSSILISHLQSALPENHEIITQLANKNITAISLNHIPQTFHNAKMDALSSINIVTGYKAVIMAANQLPRFVPMVSTANGSIGPAQFLVIGAGAVGLQAIATARQLGGAVKALDIREDARLKAESLGAWCIPFYCPEEFIFRAEGCIAGDWLEIEQNIIEPHLEDADIVILSAHILGEAAPILVTEQMISTMKPGSVIMDISVDHGGNCEVTVPDQIIQKLGIYVCGISNIPGMMAMDASTIYAENIFNFVKHLFKNGIGHIDLKDEKIKSCIVTYGGKVLNQIALRSLAIKEASSNLKIMGKQKS